jgi:hypothetical protein
MQLKTIDSFHVKVRMNLSCAILVSCVPISVLTVYYKRKLEILLPGYMIKSSAYLLSKILDKPMNQKYFFTCFEKQVIAKIASLDIE